MRKKNKPSKEVANNSEFDVAKGNGYGRLSRRSKLIVLGEENSTDQEKISGKYTLRHMSPKKVTRKSSQEMPTTPTGNHGALSTSFRNICVQVSPHSKKNPTLLPTNSFVAINQGLQPKKLLNIIELDGAMIKKYGLTTKNLSRRGDPSVDFGGIAADKAAAEYGLKFTGCKRQLADYEWNHLIACDFYLTAGLLIATQLLPDVISLEHKTPGEKEIKRVVKACLPKLPTELFKQLCNELTNTLSTIIDRAKQSKRQAKFIQTSRKTLAQKLGWYSMKKHNIVLATSATNTMTMLLENIVREHYADGKKITINVESAILNDKYNLAQGISYTIHVHGIFQITYQLDNPLSLTAPNSLCNHPLASAIKKAKRIYSKPFEFNPKVIKKAICRQLDFDAIDESDDVTTATPMETGSENVQLQPLDFDDESDDPQICRKDNPFGASL